MELTQKQSQKLSMTAAMLQSLELLQLPVCELVSHLQDAALSNPLLEVELPGVGTLAEEGHTVLRESSRWDNLPSSRGDDNSLENLAGAHTAAEKWRRCSARQTWPCTEPRNGARPLPDRS